MAAPQSESRRGDRAERAVPAAGFVVTWTIELLLAERKYGVFGGGFGQSHALTGAGEIALFLAVTGLAQLLFCAVPYLAMRAAIRDPARQAVRLYVTLFLTIGLAALIAAAKYELLSYFSDTVSFQLLRNLGGGSLMDAARFGLSEGALIGEVTLGALILFAGGLLVVRRLPGRAARPALGGRMFAALALLFALLALGANRNGDVRRCAGRMTAYALATGALDRLTDFDGDGYSYYSALIDDAPFDASRHPLALDIPGDGIDQDGVGGDFLPLVRPPESPPPALPRRPKNLVLIVLESTRGDVIGKRIDGRVVAPNLEALAKEGSSAAAAFSHVGFTTGSLKALFSGRLEPRAGDPSLFRDLKRGGYRIAVFSGQPEDFGDIARVTGMRQASDIFVDAETLKADRAFSFAAQGSLLVDERRLLAAFDARLGRKGAWARPNFVYFNFQSAHFPYHHPGMADLIDPHPLARNEIGIGRRDDVARTYWNAVAWSDRMIGAVIARLKMLGVWKDTLLVVTADHGESLFDDGFLGHGHIVNRIQTHIPLVLSAPHVDLSGAIGLSDYRDLIRRVLANAPQPRRSQPVFQYIGPLDMPTVIGMAEADGRQTSLNLETRDVTFIETGRVAPLASLAPGSPAQARARRLIREWEQRRWDAHRGMGVR